MEEFISQCREAYKNATGLIPLDENISRYALAYQIAILNQNLEELLITSGMAEAETDSPETGA